MTLVKRPEACTGPVRLETGRKMQDSLGYCVRPRDLGAKSSNNIKVSNVQISPSWISLQKDDLIQRQPKSEKNQGCGKSEIQFYQEHWPKWTKEKAYLPMQSLGRGGGRQESFFLPPGGFREN